MAASSTSSSAAVAHESKVGYTALTKDVVGQIAKDVELIGTGRIESSVWHFFRSPVTGRVGLDLNGDGFPDVVDVAGRLRIPDGLNLETKVLSEVKNVESLSYTQQLRDFAAHARANGLRFDLWVRPTTQLSGPLAEEVASRAINLRFIP